MRDENQKTEGKINVDQVLMQRRKVDLGVRV
ncbi:hypothetical protein Hgul01_03869 [Herpetosiphon gulosus]|uniref:Uncharacterized protein n=1 Tax=Herpetosiphon gulosus TaxID=1973496 RepID=A0ABP9X3S3_9CHLR